MRAVRFGNEENEPLAVAVVSIGAKRLSPAPVPDKVAPTRQ